MTADGVDAAVAVVTAAADFFTAVAVAAVLAPDDGDPVDSVAVFTVSTAAAGFEPDLFDFTVLAGLAALSVVCAPPLLLLTVTPAATSVLDTVDPELLTGSEVPEGVIGSVAVEPLPVDVAAGSDDGCAVPDEDSAVELDDELDSDDPPVVSAAAIP
ncbi:hypothetical protein [Mycolicibacterium fluoranthenivorans]|uniref:hypothetical protein n=1 Tax=Mycolicibacterium fluoranthenivorans TaxID=258505 RepID=UPI0011139899|nr:hypothetical protein [Mycolicibacterium fluoranthenivorans]